MYLEEQLQAALAELNSMRLAAKLLLLDSNTDCPASEVRPPVVPLHGEVSTSNLGQITDPERTERTKNKDEVSSAFDIPVLVNGCVYHNRHSIVALPVNGINRPRCASEVSDNNQHNVLILGDSHVRGCSEKLADILGSGFTVTGILKPNANMSAISDFRYLKTEKLSKSDVVIVCGGTRDVAKNESKEGLRKISQLAGFLNNTNVIVTCVPHRYDLQADSCVTTEVELFIRKLQKQLKAFEHVKICKLSDPMVFT
jgi:hypothetical protein